MIKTSFCWIRDKVTHKLEHYSKEKIKKFFKENGLAFVVIFIVWEIIEDVLFPLLFIWLGNNVNPWWHTGAPISWLLCLHPVAVPALWWVWIRLRGSNKKNTHVCGDCNEDNRK